MSNFDRSDLRRIAISAIGAIAISSACLVGVAGPVRAATASPAAGLGAAAK